MSTKTIQIDYCPLPTQAKFHQSPAKFKLYCGGLGGGKTTAGCQEVLKLSLLYPRNIGIICRQTYTELEDTTMRTFFDICPPEIIWDYNKIQRRLILTNGSTILFRSLDSPYKIRLELGWFYIDEASEISEETFLTLCGRLRASVPKHFGILTSNPVNVTHWLYKYFVINKTDDFEVFMASTYENKANLPEGYIETLEKNYPPTWVKKYLCGHWGFSTEGQPVFSDFKENTHVRDLRYITEEPVYVGLDFGYRHPCAIASQIDSQDRWIILKEFMPENITAHEFAQKLLDFLRAQFPLASRFLYFGDPACRQKSDKNERTTADIFREYNILISSRVSSIASRIEIISKRLRNNTLLIDRSCRVLIDALAGGYHYKENTDEPEHDEYYSHVIDSLGYIAVGLFNTKDAKILLQDYLPQRLKNCFLKK